MFELDNQMAKLNSVNPRAEKHGTDNEMAADFGFTIKVSNDILSEFHPKLKSSFYEKEDSPQEEIEQDINHLPQAKFPNIGDIKWGGSLGDYDFVFHHGIGGKSDIEMADCVVDKFTFSMADGGTVAVSFKVSGYPKSIDLGKICENIQDEVYISLSHSENPDVQEDVFKE